jgi:hypothetical protein
MMASQRNSWGGQRHDQGPHLLLQTRVRTLNGELSAIFKRWYPDMNLKVEEMPVAA